MKIKMEFKGFEQLARRLEEVGGDLKATTEKALKECHNAVTPGIESAIVPHHRSGDTEKSLVKNASVNWNGDEGSINVGFNIKQGGLPSIFLMYGTPRMAPDKKLYNSIYGNAVKTKVKKIEKDIFMNEIVARLIK